MTLALALARPSIIFAWISRDHGQRPILSMLCLSIAMTETLSDGDREEARTPQSYAERSRLWMIWEPPANSSTSVTPRPRTQSFFQNPALVIASPVCSYCCSTRECAPESPLHFTLSPSEIGPPGAAGRCFAGAPTG